MPDIAYGFCPICGSPMRRAIPEGDNRERDVCETCGFIHYVNPLLVVGTIPVFGDKILLCKRAIEPRYGKWTLPAGFLEAHEGIGDGALRETVEESGAHVKLGQLFTFIDCPKASHEVCFFISEMQDSTFDPGPETIEARLFAEDEIPWDELSFTTVKTTLEHFFADRRKGTFSLHYYALSD
ncbi:MAG TPA: NUDIX hydrolase [Sutterella sp.]|nr:NUDIX hydrolase [Sutterella sp.]